MPNDISMSWAMYERAILLTRRREREAACQDVCEACRAGLPLKSRAGRGRYYYHRRPSGLLLACKASPIRERGAREDPEDAAVTAVAAAEEPSGSPVSRPAAASPSSADAVPAALRQRGYVASTPIPQKEDRFA